MSFSVSFVYKAVDKYSAIIKKISKVTKDHAKLLEKLNQSTNKTTKILATNASQFKKSTNEIIRYNRVMKTAVDNTSKLRSHVTLPRVPKGPMGGGMGGSFRGRGQFINSMEQAALPMGVMGAALTAPFILASKAAMQFESAFADVKKVVNFDSQKELEQYQDMIKDMSTAYPMMAKDITALVAAAGQAGVAKKDLEEFTKVAIEAGVAFDMPADQIGETFAKIKSLFSLGISDLRILGDQVNMLSNNQASKAAEVVDIIKRVGSSAALIKMSSANLAAFGSTLVDIGQPAMMVDNALNILFSKLGASDVLPDNAQAAFAKMGLGSGEAFKQAMEKDSTKAILSFLNHLKKHSKDAPGLITKILGVEHVKSVGALALNVEKLRGALEDVNNPAKYLGSMLKEYLNRKGTLENSLLLLSNTFNIIGVEVGELLNEFIKPLIPKLVELGIVVVKFIREHPKLTMALAAITLGVGALAIAVAGLAGAAFFLAPLVFFIKQMKDAGTVALVMAKVGNVMSIITRVIMFLGSPLGLVIAGFTAMVALGTALYANWQPFRNLINSMINLVNILWQSSLKNVANAWGWASQGCANFTKDLIEQHGWLKWIVDLITKAGDALKNYGSYAMEGIGRMGKDFNNFVNMGAVNMNNAAAQTATANGLTGPSVINGYTKVDINLLGDTSKVANVTAKSGSNTKTAVKSGRTGKQM